MHCTIQQCDLRYNARIFTKTHFELEFLHKTIAAINVANISRINDCAIQRLITGHNNIASSQCVLKVWLRQYNAPIYICVGQRG